VKNQVRIWNLGIGIWSLLFLALVLRLAFLLLAGVNAPLAGDEIQYQQLAANVAAGRGFVQNNNPFFPGQVLHAWQAPLYPLSLAVLYFFFGPSALVAKLFNIAVGVVTVYVTYDLARRVFSNQRVAFVAALFAAVYPGFLTNAHLLLSETLFTFLIVLAFDLIVASTAGSNQRAILLAVLAGAAWGAATLTRGITLYFVVPLALWWLVVSTRGVGANTSVHHHDLGRGLTALLVFVLAMVAVLAPWTMRNYTVFHQFVMLETKGGVNFWLGNSPYTPSDFIRNVWKTDTRGPMLAVLPQDEIARDHVGYALGLAYIERAPLTFLARMPVKFADFWSFERSLTDTAESTRTGRGTGWTTLSKIGADFISDVAYILLMLLAIGGLVLAPDDQWKLLFGGFILYFILVHITVFGDGRFHFPLIPILALYGAWFVVNARRVGWSIGRVAATGALVVVFAAVWVHEIAAAMVALRGG
jgi:4-amino-4-deoxy-L-arabinose transferase-like glycosyltransferase